MRTLGTALVLAAMAASPAMAQEQTRGTILSISGSGLAVVEPDMATITLGVRNFGPSAVSVTNENARRMISLRDALRRAGVEERDIQTSAISVSPRYRRVGDNYRVPDGYDASNSVRARVREIDDVGAVLDAAIAAGGNDVDGVRFGLQDPEAALDSARMDALTDARERAADYAETLGCAWLALFR